jgi:alkylated DNA repair dioxygenase AlkB
LGAQGGTEKERIASRGRRISAHGAILFSVRIVAESTALFFLKNRQSEVEGRSVARFRFDPNATIVTLDYPATDGQTDPRAGPSIVESFKDFENVLTILRIDSNAVIMNTHAPGAALSLSGDKDVG